MDAALGDLSGWLGFRVSIPENSAGGHLPTNKNLPASSSLHSLDCFVSCWFAFGVCLFVWGQQHTHLCWLRTHSVAYVFEAMTLRLSLS